MSGRYVVRRLLQAVPTLVGLSVMIFLLSAFAGNPAAQLAAEGSPDGEASAEAIAAISHELGLDRPLPVRYGRWVTDALHGDLGTSLFTNRTVTSEIQRGFPATVVLAGSALAFIVVLAVPVGVAGALFHRHWGDQLVRIGALVGASVPAFFLAYLLIDLLAVRLRVLPVAGLDGPASLVLPALALAVGPAAMVSRLLRASLLDVLGEGYMLTAKAKGLASVPTIMRHGVRNAALPVLTVLGGTLGRMLEGAVIIEVIFAWPGIGLLTYNGIIAHDYPLVVGTVLFGGAVFVALNLVVDLSYGLVDPRVRVGAKA